MDEDKIKQIFREELSNKFPPIMAAQAIHLHFDPTAPTSLHDQAEAANAATDLLYKELERIILEFLVKKFSSELNRR